MTATDHLAQRFRDVVRSWARAQHELVELAGEIDQSGLWADEGAPTPAHWIAAAADVKTGTAREWVRIARLLKRLEVIADAFATGRVSYSKVRTLTRVATPENQLELLAIAEAVTASELAREIAAWMTDTLDSDELAKHQKRSRSVRWRTEPDGMVTFSLRLPPLVAGMLVAFLTAWVAYRRRGLTRSGRDASADGWPSLAQQRADAVEALLSDGGGKVNTEVVLHVRGDGCSLDDGTPIPDSTVASQLPAAFIRALVHEAADRPVNASGRRRRPTTAQKRVVKERDRVCVDCGSSDLLEYDHNPPYQTTGQTHTDELQLRCGPCHRRRHDTNAAEWCGPE